MVSELNGGYLQILPEFTNRKGEFKENQQIRYITTVVGKPIWGIVKRVLLEKYDIERSLLTMEKQGRHNIKYALS
jgi:hypothetical protein